MYTDIALFILRVFTGLFLLIHGWPKLKNFTGTMKWLHSEGFPLVFLSTCGVIAAEFLGGILLILGIYVQFVSVIIAFNMLVATLFHIKKKAGWKATEPAVLYLLVAVVLSLVGGGAWTLL